MADPLHSTLRPQKITFEQNGISVDGKGPAELANQGRILLQELLTGRQVCWLDGFVLFRDWREKVSKGSRRKRFAVQASRVGGALGELGIEGWDVDRDPPREGPWRLRISQASRYSSSVQECVRLAREAVAAFGRGDGSAWRSIEQAWHTQVIDALAVAEAIEAAPSPPGDEMDGDVQAAILGVIGAREKALCAAVAKVARQIQHRDPEITLAEAEETLVRWIRQVLVLRAAEENLGSALAAKPPRCSSAAKEFVQLVRQYLRCLPEVGSRDSRKTGTHASEHAIGNRHAKRTHLGAASGPTWARL
jgi:hypothetical protein